MRWLLFAGSAHMLLVKSGQFCSGWKQFLPAQALKHKHSACRGGAGMACPGLFDVGLGEQAGENVALTLDVGTSQLQIPRSRQFVLFGEANPFAIWVCLLWRNRYSYSQKTGRSEKTQPHVDTQHALAECLPLSGERRGGQQRPQEETPQSGR